VVVISTAHGLKFTEFKLGYHQGQLQDHNVNPQFHNEPVVLPADTDAVRRAIFDRIEANRELTV